MAIGDPNYGNEQVTKIKMFLWLTVSMALLAAVICVTLGGMTIAFCHNADISVSTMEGVSGAFIALALIVMGASIGFGIAGGNNASNVKAVLPTVTKELEMTTPAPTTPSAPMNLASAMPSFPSSYPTSTFSYNTTPAYTPYAPTYGSNPFPSFR